MIFKIIRIYYKEFIDAINKPLAQCTRRKRANTFKTSFISHDLPHSHLQKIPGQPYLHCSHIYWRNAILFLSYNGKQNGLWQVDSVDNNKINIEAEGHNNKDRYIETVAYSENDDTSMKHKRRKGFDLFGILNHYRNTGT